MMSTIRWWIVIASVCLTACGSTEHQLKQAQLTVLTEAQANTEALLARVQSHSIPVADYDIHAFFKMDVLNRALVGMSGLSLSLPNDDSITVTLREIKLSSLGALPLVSIHGEAAKGDLQAEVEASGVLEPDPGTGPGAMRIELLTFAPKIRWFWFEVTKARFAKNLIAAEALKLSDRLPRITLPLNQNLAFGAEASSMQHVVPTGGNGSTLTLQITVPSTRRDRTLQVIDTVYANDGIHLFGRLQ